MKLHPQIKELRERYRNRFSHNQYKAVEEVLLNKYQPEELDKISINLKEDSGNVVRVDLEDESLYADPEKDHCVEHGNYGTEVPPEGKAEMPEGDDKYGLR
jgi:hypothetical protein